MIVYTIDSNSTSSNNSSVNSSSSNNSIYNSDNSNNNVNNNIIINNSEHDNSNSEVVIDAHLFMPCTADDTILEYLNTILLEYYATTLYDSNSIA